MSARVRPADAVRRHWSERLAPKAAAFAQLARWDRPVGWRLLYAPCVMALALVAAPYDLADLRLAILTLIGAVAMRGAGCTYNDILDQRIDAKVERTAGRPLPSGRVSLKEAWLWLFAQCGVGLVVLLALPAAAQIVSLASLPVVAAYPLMKRVTWWPQAWLGLAFSWGALSMGAAIEGGLSLRIGLLYAGCVAWVIAYDTIYALQDREDDALIGVRSTARLFGSKWRAGVSCFYVLAFALWAAAAPATAWPALGVLAGLTLLAVARAPEARALEGFKANVWLGLAVATAFALGEALQLLA